jgi:hypothetical protein
MNSQAKILDFLGMVFASLIPSRGIAQEDRDGIVTIGAIMHPKDGKADALRQSLLSLVEPTHKEPGCIT